MLKRKIKFLILCFILLSALFTCNQADLIDSTTTTTTTISDSQAVALDKAALDYDDFAFTSPDTSSDVTQNFTLPTSGSNGTTISWVSSDMNYVSITGGAVDVTRPASWTSDQTVTLTATISKGSSSDTKAFTVTIKKNASLVEKIKHASDKQCGDSFGHSVSLGGDYAIVGALFEDGGSGDSTGDDGAAYIYERDESGNWAEKAILHASDMQSGDYFGCSVSISGNYAIVGALYEDGSSGDPAINAGAAYIFERDGSGNWTEKAILHASDMQSYDLFGRSVSISDDYAIIGANLEDGGSGDPAIDAGAAYIFE